jgi:Ca2+-dependent lipid-binding protein
VLQEISRKLVKRTDRQAWTEIMRNSRYQQAVSGSRLPDPYAIINFSNNQTLKTPVIYNSLHPQWGAMANISLAADSKVEIFIYDKDLMIDDLIGHRPFTSIPKHILKKGGTLRLRFQQVYEISLIFSLEEHRVIGRFEPGIYRITVIGAKIHERKSDGRHWDFMFGLPDPYAIITLGQHRIVTPVAKNTLAPIWNHSAELTLSGDERFQIKVLDKDVGQDDIVGSCHFIRLNEAPLIKGILFHWRCQQILQIKLQFTRLK